MFDHIQGQFAFCIWDSRTNEVILARDRAGICPLFYTVVKHDGTHWLLFASEMKALFASGLVDRKPDMQGLNHIFTLHRDARTDHGVRGHQVPDAGTLSAFQARQAA